MQRWSRRLIGWSRPFWESSNRFYQYPMNLLSLLKQSLRDYLSPKIIFLTLLPSMLGLVFWLTLLYAYGATIEDQVLALLPQWLTDNQIGGIVNFTLKAMIFFFLCFILLCLILLGNILAMPFYAPILISHLHTQAFSHIPKQSFASAIECLGYSLKLIGLFCLSFAVCLPLYFIPILGSLALFVIGFIFFQKAMFFDIASSMMSREQFVAISKSAKRRNFAIALLAYILNFIPLINFFMMPLQILIITRYLFMRLDPQASL